MNTPTATNPLLGTPSAPRSTSEIRIYVACLAAYNNGCLHGRWIDAMQGEDHIWLETSAMLAASPVQDAEEYAIHGAICKSHLLSEAERPLVQPSGSFPTGACGLGNRLVRSLRERSGAGSHKPANRTRERPVWRTKVNLCRRLVTYESSGSGYYGENGSGLRARVSRRQKVKTPRGIAGT